MGWRERDYARFTKEEWDALTGTGGVHRIAGQRSRDGFPWFLTAILIVMVGTIMLLGRDKLSPLTHRVTALVSPMRTAESARPPLPERTNVVRIRWRETDLAPAAAAGRICVTDAGHGRICAAYVAGERPADTLARRLTSFGLRVESSG